MSAAPGSAARQAAERLADGLYPHQVEGLAFLLGRRRSILADDMGLGKTRQSVLALVHAEPRGPWLVVCPASVKRNWEREIRLVLPDAATHVVGTGAGPRSRRGRSLQATPVVPAPRRPARSAGWSASVRPSP